MTTISKTLAAPDTGFIRPIAPVEDRSAATAVQGVSQLLSTGDDLFRAKKRADAQAAADASTAHGESLRTELKEVSDQFTQQQAVFKGQVDGIQGSSHMTEAEMKLRTRSLLRQYSEGRSREEIQTLRQISGQVLGFDPTGTAIELESARQDDIRKEEAKRRDHYMQIGGDVATYGTVAADQWYRNKTATLQAKRDVEDQLALANAKNDLASIDAPTTLQTHASGSHSQMISLVESTIFEAFNKPVSEVTDSDIQSMDPEAMKNLVLSLDSTYNKLEADTRKEFSAFPNISDSNINEALAPLKDYVDLIKRRTSLEASADEMKNRNDLNQSLMENGLWNDPQTRVFHAFGKIYPSWPMPRAATATMVKVLPTMFAGRIVNDHTGAPGDSDEAKASRAASVNWYKKFTTGVLQLPELNDEQKASTVNFIKGFSRSSINTYDDMDQLQKDSLMSILQDPNMADVIARIPESSKEAAALSSVAVEYTQAVMQAAAFDLAGQKNRTERGSAGSFGLPSGTSGMDPLDHVTFSVTAQGISVQPKTNDKFKRDIAARINERYVVRLNKGITAQANLDGIPATKVVEFLRDDFLGIPGFDTLFSEETTNE